MSVPSRRFGKGREPSGSWGEDGVMVKKFAGTIAACVLALSMFGCSQQDEGPDYADDEVVPAMSTALEKRFDLADEYERAVAEDGKEMAPEDRQAAVDIELDALSDFRNREFEDRDLQELVISYLNLLEDTKEIADLQTTDAVAFLKEWEGAYNDRTQLLRRFVEEYGLSVDAAHEEQLNEMLMVAKYADQEDDLNEAVQALADSIVIEFSTNEYGYTSGSTTVTNDTGYSFDYIMFDVNLYDEGNVRVGSTYLNANNWADGETIVLDVFVNDVVPATYKVIPDGFSVVE